MTHRRFLPLLMNTGPAMDQIYSRFINLVLKMKHNYNERVRFIAEMCCKSQLHIIGGNLSHIGQRLGIDVNEVLCCGREMLRDAYVKECNETDSCTIGYIRELMDILNGDSHMENFNANDINVMLYELCVN